MFKTLLVKSVKGRAARKKSVLELTFKAFDSKEKHSLRGYYCFIKTSISSYSSIIEVDAFHGVSPLLSSDCSVAFRFIHSGYAKTRFIAKY